MPGREAGGDPRFAGPHQPQAQERLVELQLALQAVADHKDDLEGLDRAAILKKARAGEVVVLDVRPGEEFASGHLPFARSLPVPELKKRLAELSRDIPVVAYCRGPFCVMAKEAVELLRGKYPQYVERPPHGPVIVVSVLHWTGWRAAPAS